MAKRRSVGLVIVLLAAALLVGGYFVLRPRLPWLNNRGTRPETVAVTRGAVAETIGQSGTVLARQSASLTWRAGGKIAEVLVKVGDKVQTGQVLARLDPQSLPANLLQARANLVSAQKALEDLKQGQSARAKAEADLYQAQKDYEDALDDEKLLKQPNASPANIEVAQSGYDVAQAQLNQAEQMYSFFENRPEDDVQRLQAAAQLERARKQLKNAEINLQFAKSKPNTQAANQVNSQVAVAEAALQDAQREWDRLKNGPSQDDLNAAQARIDAAQAAVEMSEIKAPFDGTVMVLNAKPGDLVKSGAAALRLDDMTELSIEVGVPEVDINRVKTDQLVSITFDAVPKKTYLGRVTQVEDVGSASQGMVSFPVHISMVDEDGSVKPGMTAAANIIVNQVEDVLLVPNRAIRFSGNQRILYLLRNGQQARVVVQTGITDNMQTQIIAPDLQEGDLVLMNPIVPTPTPTHAP